MNASDIRQKVTDKIVQSIEQGNTLCWRRPWANDQNGFGLASSLSTGNAYRGINQVILQAVSDEFGIQSKWFGTFNKIRNAGASVRKGERGIKVVLWKPVKREKTDNKGETKEDTFPPPPNASRTSPKLASAADPPSKGYLPTIALVQEGATSAR